MGEASVFGDVHPSSPFDETTKRLVANASNSKITYRGKPFLRLIKLNDPTQDAINYSSNLESPEIRPPLGIKFDGDSPGGVVISMGNVIRLLL